MKHIVLIVLIAACTTGNEKRQPPQVDAGLPDHDALEVDGFGDGSATDSSVDSPPDVSVSPLCSTQGDGSFAAQCCPFSSNCQTGLECSYEWENSDILHQEHSQCLPPSPQGLGQTCNPQAGSECGEGLFCDRVMSSAQPGDGHCRLLCDPYHPCSSGTCQPMPICSATECVVASSTVIGYCS